MTRRSPSAPERALDRNVFLLVVVALTVAFCWVILPYYGAVLWGSALALLFEPLYGRFLRRMNGRRNLAALATLVVILVAVILPLGLVGISLVKEVTAFYQRVKTGQVNFGAYFAQIVAAMPAWASTALERLGLDDLSLLQAKVTAAITARGEALAGRAVDIGGNVLDLVIEFAMALYLLFFLLRDGVELTRDIRAAIPLAPAAKERVLERFTTVIRATVRGNVLVAAVQGALGGLAFWFLGIHAAMLWAVIMAFLSLLPAVGAALIWAPVAVYLLAVGEVWQGIGLTLFCVVVIGLIDNGLRPILVGKDTKLPDYVVLISTIGGIAVIGINGFVVGPLLAAMFVAVWQLLAAERAEASA
jgi:predicted PurR-regulated permease PerM